MLNVPMLHLRFNVSQPKGHACRVDIEGTFEDGARASEFFLFQFPGRIAHPIIHVDAVPPHIVLKLLSLPTLELVQFLQVSEALRWRFELLILTVDGFSEQLLCADLDGRRRKVFNPRGGCLFHD